MICLNSKDFTRNLIAMSKATKKQIKITAELIARATHSLGELGVNYALVIEGTPCLFTNSTNGHAVAIIRDALQLQEKIYEVKCDTIAERLAAIPEEEE
jgi:hypothetical protein